MSRPGFVRWCAVAVVLGAVLGMTPTFLSLSYFFFGLDLGSFSGTNLVFYLIGYLSIVSSLLLSVGILGIMASLPGGMERLRKLMLAGICVSIVAALSLLIGATYELLVVPDYPYSLLNAIFLFGNFAGSFGFLVVGVASLRVRSLGFARFLVLPVALLGFPLLIDWFAVYFIYPRFGYDSAAVEVTYSSPQLLSGLLWIMVGVVLFGAREREMKFVRHEQELAGRRNLEIARRLYDEAWVKGEYGVLDELVSRDVVDEYHEEVGLANFRRNVAGLRRTFPDLHFVIEEQTSENDTVKTRWSLTGTDEGGILWYPPTGKEVSLSGTFTDLFEDGLLVEHRGVSDTRSLTDQLGLS